MPSKSLWKIVEFIKRDCEEWGEPLQIDEVSLYRHVEEMLDLEREPPEMPIELSAYHLFGYDISHIPGPSDHSHRMFNFRVILNPAPEQTEGMLDMARALPLPE